MRRSPGKASIEAVFNYGYLLCCFDATDESAYKASRDVIKLIKGEFGGLGVGEGHGFVRVRCVGVGCV